MKRRPFLPHKIPVHSQMETTIINVKHTGGIHEDKPDNRI